MSTTYLSVKRGIFILKNGGDSKNKVELGVFVGVKEEKEMYI